jgi:hypothetical protein
MKTLRMLTLALVVAGVEMAQTTPQTSILFTAYFNRAACAALASMLPNLTSGCQQSVQVYVTSSDSEVTEFRVSIAYVKNGETLSQTLRIPNQSKVNRAVFDSGVEDVTILSESATPLKTAGDTVTVH